VLTNILKVIFKIIPNEKEDIVLCCIHCMTEIFTKEPYLVIKAYESGFEFQIFINAVRDADPEMALAGIEFWYRFIMIETVVFKEEFTRKLFE
jgi:hypothetical protein